MVEVLERIALLLELKGENSFKVRAYRQGAELVSNMEEDPVELASQADGLKGIKGIGEALQDKLGELANTGELGFYEKLKAEFPSGIFELFEVQGLGPKKVRAVWEELEVGDLAALKRVCEEGRVAQLKGFGSKTEAKILEGIAAREKYADRYLLGLIGGLVESILEELRSHPEVLRAEIAGSYRRAREICGDLDFLVATSEAAGKGAEVLRFFCDMAEVQEVIVCGETKATVRLQNGIKCDLRAVSNREFPFALQYFTGSKEHNVALRGRALRYGFSLNEYGMKGKGGGEGVTDAYEERDIYQVLELQYVEPELRENRGELEAAEGGNLPNLVKLENLRGTFHNHTTASDGSDRLQDMVQEAMDLGLGYIGISDHSKSTVVANGLDEERLLSQVEEIRQLEETLGGFRIFAGSEVDILMDGRLDFSDEILAQLDWCVASVHRFGNMDEDGMTERICRAMENEHVTMLGHVTGRALLQRDGYLVDQARIIDCAAATRTVIELNCSPKRQDMDWRWWKRARDKGVLCSINPDAHSRSQLHCLKTGVRIARKGWLRKKDILNTKTAAEVAEFLDAAKAER